jgi:protein-tyrosine-phosphatase
VVSRARDFVDSLLHSRRRRAAVRRLTNANPRSILFVCQGNICRSPFAAALLTQLAPNTFRGTIASAGFVGPGRPPPEHALTTAREYGLDLSTHRSAAVTSASLQNADLVVVMSRAQEKGVSERVKPGAIVVVLGDLDPLPISHRTIHDPWDGPPSAFRESYARIDHCVRALAQSAWSGS